MLIKFLLTCVALLISAVTAWLCLLAGAVTVFYAGAGVAMIFNLLHGSPWSQFFLVRLYFWGIIFIASFVVYKGAAQWTK